MSQERTVQTPEFPAKRAIAYYKQGVIQYGGKLRRILSDALGRVILYGVGIKNKNQYDVRWQKAKIDNIQKSEQTMAIGKYTDTIKQPGLQSFLWTQFLGALNDNIHKIVVALLAANLAVTSDTGSIYLSLVGAVFMLPFFFFSGYAGHVSDVFSKRSVLVVTKAFEIIAMILGFLAFLSGRIELMLGVVFLMALQSTFFSPAKYGILPEMLADKDLSRANGLLEMSTFLAIILGTSLGSLMLVAWPDQLGVIGLVLVGVAIAGTITSLGIRKVPPSGAQKPFQLNPWAQIGSGIKKLYKEKSLWFTVMGISYFWFLGALMQLCIILLGKEVMGLDDLRIGLLQTFLAIGIAIGSLAAGRLSGDKVELGLVPLGSIGMGVFAVLLYLFSLSYLQTLVTLIFLGISGGIFIVPLYALIQQRSEKEEKGQVIATANFLGTAGVLLASGVLWTFRDLIQVQANGIILIFGLLTLVATVTILKILPEYLIRFTLWLLTHTFYRIRIVGQEVVPFRGPALLICNHISHVDGLLVGACVQRFIRFMVYAPYYELKGLNWLFRRMNAIPVSAHNRRDILESIIRARQSLQDGHVVCIFAEGAVSRTGNLLPFKRGFEKIAEGLDVPVIPVYLDRLWGSIFSFKGGRFFCKWPERIPYPVTVAFGAPLPPAATAEQARQAIMELGADAGEYRRETQDLLPLKFLKTAKRRWFSFCMGDSTGSKATFGRALVGSLLLGRWVKRRCGTDSMVGILLPPSIAGALTNIAVLLTGKIPVNLNYSVGTEAMNQAVKQCEIRSIITSRMFLKIAKLEETEKMIFVEEGLGDTQVREKVTAYLVAMLIPSRLIRYLYHREKPDPHSPATIVFSSGSTGTPKGVMLSHHNILSNIEAIAQLFWITKKDRMMGILPFFHAFGFTGTLWFPATTGFGVIYHGNPLDSKTIGEMVFRQRGTIIIGTPTFYSSYLRRCSPEQFSSLRFAIAGAEKLPESLSKSFKEKFGLDLLEGYGCTEMAPVISVNFPDINDGQEIQGGLKPGTVGHPVPGVAVKVINPDTGELLPPGEEGLLLVKGPNRMLGYLGQPDLTAQVFKNGWYVTGDVATVDEDGFIRITDRLSRFSKVAGEMVPHIRIEEEINRILNEQACVVVAVPDKAKGEKLVVLYAKDGISSRELWEGLLKSTLPKIWIPKEENIYQVPSIPVLGTGKVDLNQAKEIAAGKTRE